MTTSHKYGCEHPDCHEVGTLQRDPNTGFGRVYRYLCAAHADEKEKADG